jgi:hypothetical protein
VNSPGCNPGEIKTDTDGYIAESKKRVEGDKSDHHKKKRKDFGKRYRRKGKG